MRKKLGLLGLLSLFLMAFQCDEESDRNLRFNNFNVSVTPESVFTVDETIWIEGTVSARAFDLDLQDSILEDFDQADDFSVYKLITPNGVSNAKDALDDFELIFDMGDISFSPSCENGLVTAFPKLAKETLLKYRIGLKPLNAGDYVISWRKAELRNENRNEEIITDYFMENQPGVIGFNSCGRTSSRLLNESDGEYYFSVE
ncbi:hypothetical protein ACJD0Z_11410 [Flavobacteriaceae bacterium M23B6Z8]